MSSINAYKKDGQIYADRVNGRGRVALGTRTRIHAGRSLDMVLGNITSDQITISSDAPAGFEALNPREEELLRRVIKRKYKVINELI